MSLIANEAVRLPVAAGVKVTETLVLAPGARVIGRAAAVNAKSAAFAPAMVRLLMIRSAVPEFVIFTVCCAELFTSRLPKLSAELSSVIAGAIPTPATLTTSGLPVAL